MGCFALVLAIAGCTPQTPAGNSPPPATAQPQTPATPIPQQTSAPPPAPTPVAAKPGETCTVYFKHCLDWYAGTWWAIRGALRSAESNRRPAPRQADG